MNNIREQATITRYIQMTSRCLPRIRPTFAKLSTVSKKHIFSTSQFTGGGGMKKLFVFLCVIGLIAASASPLFAGGIDNKTAWSAEYIRTFNRNAATDSADIVMYNPAGTTKMEDGFYGNLSVLYVAKDYSNNINGTEFDQDEPSYIPGLFLLYKKDRLAGFFGLSNVLGGGKVKFEDGDATSSAIGLGLITKANLGLAGAGVPANFFYTGINNQYLEGEHTGLGYTFGGAFKINDMFSVSLAAMYVDTHKEGKGNVTIHAANPAPSPPFPVGLNDDATGSVDYEEDADGWGGVIGLNISPTDQWNIGIRYNTKVSLDYDQTVNVDSIYFSNGVKYGDNLILPELGITNGGERTRDLPAILALGVSYKLNDKIRLEADLTYYFNEDVDWMGLEDSLDNGYDLGLALEYTFNPKFKGSIGYAHTDTGIDAKDMLPESPELNADTIAGGVAYECIPGLTLNLGIGNSFYESDSFVSSTTGNTIEYEKNNFFIALGAQYKFF
jgi:long-chain fatty acid transport protein